MQHIKGRVWKLGDNVDTDMIIAGEFLNTSEETVLASHCLEGVFPDFSTRVQPGDVIVAGKNFGCGSSREHAPMAIKAAGISCIVAESFARIFFRNAINVGLSVLENGTISYYAEAEDRISVEIDTGVVELPDKGFLTKSKPLPEFIRKILESGGLEAYYTEGNKS